MEKEKISVIVPIFNSELYLERCINSIINQTYKNLEIILIDDGSKDNSGKICDRFSKEDNRVISKHILNNGVSIARNEGIKIAKGNYIMFVDADDYLEIDAVERLYNIMKERKVEIVRGQYYINSKEIFNNDKDIINKVLEKNAIKKKLIPMFLDGKINCYIWILLIDANLLKRLKGFREKITYMEDLIFYIELFLKANNVYLCDEYIYHYNINELSASCNMNNLSKNIFDTIKVNSIIKEILNSYGINNLNKMLDTVECNSIINKLYLMQQVVDKEKLKNQFYFLRKDKQFMKMINNYNFKESTIIWSIQMFLVQKNNFNMLYIIFLIKKFIKKII